MFTESKTFLQLQVAQIPSGPLALRNVVEQSPRIWDKFFIYAILINIMSVKTDSHGRLYLSSELRQKYGERFHVVEYEDRLELIPIDENPLEAIREAAGDTFENESIDELREGVRDQAKKDAEAGFDRGKLGVEDRDE